MVINAQDSGSIYQRLSFQTQISWSLCRLSARIPSNTYCGRMTNMFFTVLPLKRWLSNRLYLNVVSELADYSCWGHYIFICTVFSVAMVITSSWRQEINRSGGVCLYFPSGVQLLNYSPPYSCISRCISHITFERST